MTPKERAENYMRLKDGYKNKEEQKQNLIDMMQDDEKLGLYDYGWCKGNVVFPNEEPKQRYEKYSERFDNKKNEIVQGIFNPSNWGKRVVDDSNKQETLEEVAERLYPNGCDGTDRSAEIYRRIFIEGVKWQQERSYSEEEVLKFTQTIIQQYKFGNTNIEQLDLLKETLQQFKKK